MKNKRKLRYKDFDKEQSDEKDTGKEGIAEAPSTMVNKLEDAQEEIITEEEEENLSIDNNNTIDTIPHEIDDETLNDICKDALEISAYNSDKPKEFIERLNEKNDDWKDLDSKNGIKSYLKINKKKFKLNNDDINIITDLRLAQIKKQKQAKTTPSKQQKSGGKSTSHKLTIDEAHRWRMLEKNKKIANYMVLKINNQVEEKEEYITIKMTLDDNSRKIELIILDGVNLDIDTLMTEECYDSILQQTKMGGLPLLTVSDLKQIYEDLLENQSEFIYFKRDIYYKLAALYSITTYFTEIFNTIGYVDIKAPDLGFGKTQLLEIIIYSSFHGVWDIDITAPNIYRRMKHGIILTMGFDDVDNKYGKDNEQGGLTGVIDSGYKRGARVSRINSITGESTKFPTFGPKLWTRKTKIPKSLLSRAIPFPMVLNRNKLLKNRQPTPKDFETIRNKLYLMRWSIMDEVKSVYTNLMETRKLTGRIGEVFLPVLVVAKLIDEKLYEEILRFAILCDKKNKQFLRNQMKAMMIEVLCKNFDFRGKIKGTEIVDQFNLKLAREKYLKTRANGESIHISSQKVYPILDDLNFDRGSSTGNAMYVDVDIEKLEDLSYAYGFEDLFTESEKFGKDFEKKREKEHKKLQAEGHTEKEILENEVFGAIGDSKSKD